MTRFVNILDVLFVKAVFDANKGDALIDCLFSAMEYEKIKCKNFDNQVFRKKKVLLSKLEALMFALLLSDRFSN